MGPLCGDGIDEWKFYHIRGQGSGIRIQQILNNQQSIFKTEIISTNVVLAHFSTQAQ
jgi:hypothetical protein